MRASTVVILVCVSLGGCQKTEPPPATAPPKADTALSDLLRRADAVTPKEEPAATTPPAQPGGVSPAPVTLPNASARPPAYSTYYPPAQSRRSPMAAEQVKTDLERMQDQARVAFADRIRSLAQTQGSLNALRARKAIACTGTSSVTVSGAYRPNTALNPNVPRAPNSYPPPAGAFQTENANSPECRSLTAALTSQEMTFRTGMDQIDSDARKMGIYPGVIRDLYAKAGISM